MTKGGGKNDMILLSKTIKAKGTSTDLGAVSTVRAFHNIGKGLSKHRQLLKAIITQHINCIKWVNSIR